MRRQARVPQQLHRLGARERGHVVDVLLALTAVTDLLVAGHPIPRDLTRDRDLDQVEGVGGAFVDDGEGAAHAGLRRGSHAKDLDVAFAAHAARSPG